MISIDDNSLGFRAKMYGLAADKPLPTEDIPNASTFYEMDTGKTYMFDAEGKTWIDQDFSGG